MKRKGAARLAARMVAAALALLLAGLLLLHTEPIRRRVLQAATDALQRDFGLQLTANHLEYNLFTGTITLGPSRLIPAHPDSLKYEIRADALRLQLALWPLLRRSVRISDAQIQGLVITAVREKLDQNRGERPPAAEAGKAPASAAPDILISKLQIRQASLHYEDRPGQLELDLPQWQLELTGEERTLAHILKLTAPPGSTLRRQGRSLLLQDVRLEALLKPDGLELRSLELQSPAGRLRMSGQIRGFSEPDLNLQLDSSLELEQALEFSGTAAELSGSVRVLAGIAGNWNSLHLSGRAEADRLSVLGVPDVRLSAEADYDTGSNSLSLKSFAVESARGSAHGSAQIDLASRAEAASRLQAEMSGLDLLTLSGDFKLPVRIASRAGGKISARWPGLEWKQMAGEAEALLEPTRSPRGQGMLPVAARLHARLDGDISRLELTSASVLGIQLQGRLAVRSFQTIEGRLSARSDSLKSSLEQLQGTLGRRIVNDLGLELDGAASADAILGGSLQQPTMTAEFAGSGIRAGPLRDIAIQGLAAGESHQLHITETRIRWQGQQLQLQGDLDLGSNVPVLTAAASVEGAELQPLISGFFSQLPVSGTLQTRIEAAGPLDRIRGRLTSRISNLSVYGEPLGDLEADAELAARKLQLHFLRLQQPGSAPPEGSLQAAGAYDLDTGKYSLQASGQGLQFKKLTLPGDQPLQGRFSLDATSSGTLAQPEATILLAGREVAGGAQDLGSIQLRARLEQGILQADVELPELRLNGTGQLNLQAPFAGEIKLMAQNTDVSRLRLTLAADQILQGRLSGEIMARGELADWQGGQASARIGELRLMVGEAEIQNEGPVELRLDRNELAVPAAALTWPRARLQLAGRLPLTAATGTGTLNATFKGELASLQRLFPPSAEVQAAGTLDLQLQLSGSLQKPQADGRLSLRGGSLAAAGLQKPIEELEADAALSNGLLKAEKIRARWAGAEIEAHGDMPLGLLPWNLPEGMARGSGPANFALEVRGLPLEAVAELPAEVSGVIGLRLQGQAGRFELGAVQAQALLTPMRLRFGELFVEQAAPAVVELANGMIHLGPVSLQGPGTALELRGSAGLTGSRPLALTAEGRFDAALLAYWVPGMKASGDTRFRVTLGGTPEAPDWSGFIEARQGQLSMRSLGLLAEGVDLRMGLRGDRVEVEKLAGTLNGGALQATGSARLRQGQLEDVNLSLSAGNLFLNVPPGVKFRGNAELQVRSRQENLFVVGQARILEGSYRERLDLEGNLLGQLGKNQALDSGQPRSALLSRVRYDLGLSTEGPLVIDNNLAKLTLDADLRLGGSYYKPVITGRITAAEGGQVVFNERRYLLERGTIDLLNQAETEPSLDIAAKTRVGGDEITVQVSGTPKTMSTRLSSTGGKSESDIASLLITGRTLDQLRGSELNVAKEQLLSQLTGRLGSSLTQSAGSALGLNELRIEPNLIAPESEPGARLTVGKDLTGNLKLVYSMNLANGGDQIWLAEFDYRRMFNSRAIKQADNSYRYEFRHDLSIGGKAVPPRLPGRPGAATQKVGRIDFFGQGPLPPEKLASSFKIHSGDKFDFFKLQEGLQRLGDLYTEQNRLEARIRADRETSGERLELSVRILPGPRIDFVFEGWGPPAKLKDRIRKIWHEGLVDTQRTDEASLVIRRSLVDQGYLQGHVESRTEAASADQRRILFIIQPGRRYSRGPVVFEGLRELSPELLRRQIDSARLTAAMVAEPELVVDQLVRFYRGQGYLDATVATPRLEFNALSGLATPRITVHEGRRIRIGPLHFQGNHALSEYQLQPAAGLASNAVLEMGLLDAAADRIEKLYWLQGYNDVEVRATLERNPDSDAAGIRFDIEEKMQSVLAEVRLQGAKPALQDFARDRLELAEGEILSYDKLIRARKNVYQSGAFALVDLSTVEAPAAGNNPRSDQKPVAVQVQLREPRPIQIHYGGFYDTDRGPGGIADAALNNFLGGPRILGLQGRYDRQLHEVRGFYSQPALARWPLKTSATVFLRREVYDTFLTDRLGFSVQQEARWRRSLLLSYGYRYERAHTFDKVPDPDIPFDSRLPIGRLTGAASRDTRDDLLDASHGSFLSQALEFSAPRLGSDLYFIKYYGQYFKYLPLSGPAEIAYGAGLRRSRWIFATGARLGLAKGLGGQNLIASERFLAGGGTTIRGFDQDQAGPRDFLGNPEGGDALLLLNNELRFPMLRLLDGVGFVDLGNIYRRISDFDPWSVRKTAGLGLRIRTPYFLLRLDYGFKLDRKPGESLGRFFFSIGQAY